MPSEFSYPYAETPESRVPLLDIIDPEFPPDGTC